MAAYDPLFFLVHTNLDRITQVYQQRYPDSWLEYTKEEHVRNYMAGHNGFDVDGTTPLWPFRYVPMHQSFLLNFYFFIPLQFPQHTRLNFGLWKSVWITYNCWHLKLEKWKMSILTSRFHSSLCIHFSESGSKILCTSLYALLLSYIGKIILSHVLAILNPSNFDWLMFLSVMRHPLV